MAYQVINSVLLHNESELQAAEAHGIACALLIVDLHTPCSKWLSEIFTEQQQLAEEDENLLNNLFEQTRNVLNPEEAMFDFDLFLPEDEEELQQKSKALSLWCQGFLWGIGYLQKDNEYPEEVSEILHDLVEFTKLDDAVQEEDEEAQESFMQIHEYLRAAILMIRDALE